MPEIRPTGARTLSQRLHTKEHTEKDRKQDQIRFKQVLKAEHDKKWDLGQDV